MSDPIEQTYEDVRGLARDYFGIGEGEAETLTAFKGEVRRLLSVAHGKAGYCTSAV